MTLSCGTGALTALVTGSTFVVQDGFDASTQAFAFLFSAGAVAVVLMTVLNRRLLRSFSARRLLVAGLAINAVGALALLTVGRLSLLVYASCFIVAHCQLGAHLGQRDGLGGARLRPRRRCRPGAGRHHAVHDGGNRGSAGRRGR